MIWLAGIAGRGWAEAQWRGLVVLAVALHTPVISDVAAFTGTPRVLDTTVAGVPATIALPAGGGRHPAVVFLNGATAAGRHEPHVERLTRALGDAGFITVVPDPPGLAQGDLSLRTLRGIEAVVADVSRRPDVSRTGLLGVSVGCSLGMVAAEDTLARAHLSDISCLAPYVDLRAVIMMALTHRYPVDGRLVPYAPDPFTGLVIARSLAAGLPPGPGRDVLLVRLLAISDNARAPLVAVSRIPTAGLDPPELALLRLLANRDPARFAGLYARLPASLRAGVGELSPLAEARRLHGPVQIATSPTDKYFPLVQYGPLQREAPDVQLTVTSVLGHAIPHPSVSNLAGVARLDGFAVRTLRDFAPPVPLNWLAVAASLLGIALIAAEGWAKRHGLVALAGLVALLATVPAITHAGFTLSLLVSVLAVAAGVALAIGMPIRRPRLSG